MPIFARFRIKSFQNNLGIHEYTPLRSTHPYNDQSPSKKLTIPSRSHTKLVGCTELYNTLARRYFSFNWVGQSADLFLPHLLQDFYFLQVYTLILRKLHCRLGLPNILQRSTHPTLNGGLAHSLTLCNLPHVSGFEIR